MEKGDFIIYVDESGDHSLDKINKDYPIFVLTFCLFSIADYIHIAVPTLQHFKFKYFGHDQIVLHETDLRKNKPPFGFLRTDRELRENFLSDLSESIEKTPFSIIPVLIDKIKLKTRYTKPYNPYNLGLRFGLERLNDLLLKHGQEGKEITIVFEKRGEKEDNELELEFLRICKKNEQFGYKSVKFNNIYFKFLLADKKTNSSGLQLADLTARPIGLNFLRPGQENRAYDIIKNKIYGCKKFP